MSSFIELAKTDPDRAKKRLNQMRNNAEREGFWQGVYTMLTPKDLCIECGAGIGTRAEQIAATGAELVAFEGDPNAFDALGEKLKGSENVTLHQGVAINEETTRPLFRKENYDAADQTTLSNTTIQPTTDRGFVDAGENVATFNLMEILKDHLKSRDEIALLYINGRGSELEIAEEILRSEVIKKIRLIYVVIYPHLRPEDRERYQVIQDFSKNHPEWNFIVERA